LKPKTINYFKLLWELLSFNDIPDNKKRGARLFYQLKASCPPFFSNFEHKVSNHDVGIIRNFLVISFLL